MVEVLRSLVGLRWSNRPCLIPLPDRVAREFVTLAGDGVSRSPSLELLVCKPWSVGHLSGCESAAREDDGQQRPAILFLHGGFGAASMYLDFMACLGRTYDAPTYALSLRGRGGSHALSYRRLVYCTGMDDLVADVNAAVEYILEARGVGSRLVIVGHSSGGGLVQYALAKRKLAGNAVCGVVLLDAIPHFGNLSVYANWAGHDPWFGVRMSLAQFNHVASPLSSDALVTGAFFGSRYRAEDVRRLARGEETRVSQFRSLMAPYESLLWPLGMMKGWWEWIRGRGGKWLDPRDVLTALTWDQRSKAVRGMEKVCVIVGSEDRLMDVPHQKCMVDQYRAGIDDLLRSKKIDLPVDDGSAVDQGESVEAGIEVDSRNGVRFVIVEGAGHHVQNDIMWEKAAEQIRRFAMRV